MSGIKLEVYVYTNGRPDDTISKEEYARIRVQRALNKEMLSANPQVRIPSQD